VNGREGINAGVHWSSGKKAGRGTRGDYGGIEAERTSIQSSQNNYKWLAGGGCNVDNNKCSAKRKKGDGEGGGLTIESYRRKGEEGGVGVCGAARRRSASAEKESRRRQGGIRKSKEHKWGKESNRPRM